MHMRQESQPMLGPGPAAIGTQAAVDYPELTVAAHGERQSVNRVDRCGSVDMQLLVHRLQSDCRLLGC